MSRCHAVTVVWSPCANSAPCLHLAMSFNRTQRRYVDLYATKAIQDSLFTATGNLRAVVEFVIMSEATVQRLRDLE